jgi:hypothetical protein
MKINWEHKWLSFHHAGTTILLQGEPPVLFDCTVVELQLIQGNIKPDHPAEIQHLLSKYVLVFSMPTTFPPRRACDHHIPLMEGAHPVRIRPYRHSPELKDEIEKQIQEMLTTGIISVSDSSFASPIIMVKRKKIRLWPTLVSL